MLSEGRPRDILPFFSSLVARFASIWYRVAIPQKGFVAEMNRDQFRERVLSEIEGVYPRAFGRESQLSLVAKIPASTSVGRRVGPNVAVEHSYTGIDITNVEDLLSLEDFQFVRCCYLALLNRDPDEIGFQANLNTLRNGTVDRLGLIRVFRESPEGKTVKAKLKGLRSITLLRKLERIPLIGPGIRLLADLARVSKLRQRIEQLESRVDRTTTLIRGSESPNDESTDQFDYDQFYLEFENHFRGDRETIKTRQSFYIPIVQELRRSLGKYPVLDISCGRGELICLLKENQIEAEGVDINAASLAECRIRNLNVRHNDAFRFLGDIEDGTYLVVTAFH